MSLSRRRFIEGLRAAAFLPLMPAAVTHTHAVSVESASKHRVMSCNIRVALEDDEKNGVGWSSRKEICLEIIEEKKPDIICLQEVLKVQAEDFAKHFKNFMLLGFAGPEMDAHPVGYHGIAKNPILFLTDRYQMVGAGTYWLSETPLIAGSKSWDTARARHANWVRLKDRKTKKEFRVVNLHLDHVSGEAKMQQAKMVVVESNQYQPEFPQILTGDFNARHDSPVFDSVREGGWKDTYAAIHGEGEAGHTGHRFQGVRYENASKAGRIDFIWMRGRVMPLASAIVRDHVNNVYPSDHFFLYADVEIGTT